jgi:hypothetical protein
MVTKVENIEVTRGDDKRWSLLLTKRDGTPHNITDWIVFFTVKQSHSDADASAKIVKNITSHADPINGMTLIDLAAADTASLTLGDYYYDIQTKTPTGKIYTIQKGKFVIAYDVTTRTVTT